jgi:hypothetical protein
MQNTGQQPAQTAAAPVLTDQAAAVEQVILDQQLHISKEGNINCSGGYKKGQAQPISHNRLQSVPDKQTNSTYTS